MFCHISNTNSNFNFNQQFNYFGSNNSNNNSKHKYQYFDIKYKFALTTDTSTSTSNQIASVQTTSQSTTISNPTTAAPSILMPNSSILNSIEIQKIYELGSFSTSQALQLLYRATIDGFGAASFHSKCDGYLNTLTMIESSSCHVFCGFRWIWSFWIALKSFH